MAGTSAKLRRVALALALTSPILMGVDSCTRVKVVAGQDDTAGDYKGPVDPLTLESSVARADTLSQRLQLIQAR